jgi:5'-nucleotidase
VSLKVVGHWKYWSEGMSAHWASVTDKVSTKHPLLAAGAAAHKGKSDSAAAPKTGWDQWTPESIRQRRGAALAPADDESDSDVEDEKVKNESSAIEEMDREIKIMRRAFGKWALRAKVECKVVDELQADDVEVDWTRAIAPRVEGRIIRIGGDDVGK